MWHEHGRELLAKVEQARRNWPKYWEQYAKGETEHPPLETVNLGISRRPEDSEASLARSSPTQGRENLGLAI